MGVLAVGTAAGAAELRVTLIDQRGEPVPDAVVTVRPGGAEGAQAAVSRTAPQTKTIDQTGLTFVPYIEVFRPGDRVVFLNSDKTRHHVYSFSPPKAFEFVLNPGESSAPLALENPGAVAVGCNIHDAMVTYLYVTDAPWIARSGADGRATVGQLPAGTYAVRVWQPRLRPNRSDLVQTAVLGAAGESKAIAFTLHLLSDPRRQSDREHTHY